MEHQHSLGLGHASITRVRHFAFSLVAILSALSFGLADTAHGIPIVEYVDTALTNGFTVDGSSLPISATTAFFNVGANLDLDNTAQHEIGHALGFTIAYTLFNANVSVLGGGPNRQYQDGDDATVLAHLGPANGGTHMLTGVTVDGNNQTNDIMRPDQVVGQNWGAQDTKILQDAFDWQDKNITVNIVFESSFTAGQRATITGAAGTVSGALGTGAMAHTFTWLVTPEPGTLPLVAIGLLGFALRKKSRVSC